MGSFINPRSQHCLKSELDLFGVKPTQVSVEHSQWVEYLPLSTLTDSGPVEFLISGTGEDYIDLANTMLLCTARITNADGSELANDAAVAPVNYWLHSLWGQVDLSLNNKTVTPSSNTYPYRAYLETLLSFGEEAKRSQLTSSLWAKDAAGQHDTIANANGGFRLRKQLSAGSRAVEMIGKLHLDMMFQNRYLLNGVDVKVRLSRSKDAFSLMAAQDAEFRINIRDVRLYARKVHPSAPVLMGHIKALQRGTAKYPITRGEIKVFSVPRGDLSTNQEGLIRGQIPKRIVIGFVDNDAYNGAYHKNPFNFKHLNVNFLALYQDGRMIPGKALQPDYANRRYIRSFLTMFSGTGTFFENSGNGIDVADYSRGFTLYCFDLTPDQSDLASFDLVRHGNVRLTANFSAPLDSSVNIVVYSEYENIIEIDRHRNVIFDFAA
uniref:Uncharacterized protein F54H12.2-like n=1 Tax=Phallusia mammillata TaxID=59560 RepID=A0A6F9DSS6_9ASCI|nr:uncharacterized protein F54H12.2-like [Phallusia mammillata]